MTSCRIAGWELGTCKPMTDQARFGSVAVTALLAAAVGASLAWILHPASAPDTLPSTFASVPAVPDRLITELQGVNESLRSLVPTLTHGTDSHSTPPEPLAEADTAALAGELRRLAQAVERLSQTSTASLSSSVLEVPSADKADTALSHIASSWSQDPATKAVDMFGLSPADVLQKLGRPNYATVDGGRVTWRYKNRASIQGELAIAFADGYVINMYMH